MDLAMEFKTIHWNREKLQVDQPQPVTCETQFTPELNLGLLLAAPKPYAAEQPQG